MGWGTRNRLLSEYGSVYGLQYDRWDICQYDCCRGKRKEKSEVVGHVLGKISPEEKEVLKESRNKIFNIIDDIKEDTDIVKLMNKYNTKGQLKQFCRKLKK